MANPTSVQRPEIAKFWINRRGEALYAQFREFENRQYFDLRKYFTTKDGTMAPTTKGVTISVHRLPELAKAIDKALHQARSEGLLRDEAGK